LFRRSFGREEQESWLALLEEITEVHITDSDDSVSWNLESSGVREPWLLMLRTFGRQSALSKFVS
jgi:hypothetical protein